MKLTSENVQSVVLDCLYSDEEVAKIGHEVLKEKAAVAEGITRIFGFDPERLKKHEKDIEEMLLQLPETFLKTKGGGWSFLNACIDKDGNQWGEHRSVEELMCLGLATKKVTIPMPKDMWGMFPGGVPYFTVEM